MTGSQEAPNFAASDFFDSNIVPVPHLFPPPHGVPGLHPFFLVTGRARRNPLLVLSGHGFAP